MLRFLPSPRKPYNSLVMKMKKLIRGLMVMMLSALPAWGAVSLEEALEEPGFLWSTSSRTFDGSMVSASDGWFGQSLVTHDGVDAAQAGLTMPGWSSILDTTNSTGPRTMIFWWKVIAPGNGWLRLLSSDNEVVGRFNEFDWEPVAVDIGAGDVPLRFDFYTWNTNPPTMAFLDQISFVPTTGAPQFVQPVTDITTGEGQSFRLSVPVTGEKPMNIAVFTPQFSTGRDVFPPAMNGASSANLGFSFEATLLQQGEWRIVATNALGAVTNFFTLTVTSSPPHSLYVSGPDEVWPGAEVKLKAEVKGTPPYFYQWLTNGVPLLDETNECLVLPNFMSEFSDEIDYSFVVSNALGVATNTFFKRPYVGYTPPMIEQQDLMGTLTLAPEGGTFQYHSWSGAAPYDVRWERDGEVIDEMLNTTRTDWHNYIYGDTFNGPGVYRMRVTTPLGEVLSDPLVIQVGSGESLAEGVDALDRGWWDFPYESWYLDESDTHDGLDAARTETHEAIMRTRVTGPATICFWWRVNDGNLELSINNSSNSETQLDSPVGDSGWQLFTIDLDPGFNELAWTFRANGGGASAAVDEFEVKEPQIFQVIAQTEYLDLPFAGDALFHVEITNGVPPFTYYLFRDGSLEDFITTEDRFLDYTIMGVNYGNVGEYHFEVDDSSPVPMTIRSDDIPVFVDGSVPSMFNLSQAVEWGGSFYQYLYGSEYKPWKRAYSDFIAGDSSARTAPLNQFDYAELEVVGDIRTNSLVRLKVKAVGDSWFDTFSVYVDGNDTPLTLEGFTNGWACVSFVVTSESDEYPYIYFEAYSPDSDGVVVFFDDMQVITVPVFNDPLTDQAVEAGVVASIPSFPDGGALTYQWYFNGVAEPFQTDSYRYFYPILPENGGYYYIVASNAAGVATSSVATITVLPKTFTTTPVSGDEVKFTWTNELALSHGIEYIVQSTTNLQAAWTNHLPVTVVTNGITNYVTLPIPPGTPALFYRLTHQTP